MDDRVSCGRDGIGRPDRRRTPRAAAVPALLAAVLLSACAGAAALTEQEITGRADHDRARLHADQEPVLGPLDLDTAIARALKYNLDHRLKVLEQGLAEAKFDHVATGLLPRAAAEAGWRSRNNWRASSSEAVPSGQQSLRVSTAEDTSTHARDLTWAWNLLDFGLTAVRMRQEGDQVRIAEERRHKAVQNLIMDVRDAWWRVVAADRLLPEIVAVIAAIDAAERRSSRLIASGVGEPSEELRLQRGLLAYRRDLVEIRGRLMMARTELAALMNMAPGMRLAVALPASHHMRPRRLAIDVAMLERAALLNRPELREEDYRVRISEREVHAAWLRLLPGIELRLGSSYDSNSFLLENSWISLGAQIGKNLMEIVSAPRAIRLAETGVAVAEQRRLVLSMAVVAQVHLAAQRHALARASFDAANRLHQVDRRLADIAVRAAGASAMAEAEALEARARRVVSALLMYAADAELEAARGRILGSVGLPRLPRDLDRLDVATLAREVRHALDSPLAAPEGQQVAGN